MKLSRFRKCFFALFAPHPNKGIYGPSHFFYQPTYSHFKPFFSVLSQFAFALSGINGYVTLFLIYKNENPIHLMGKKK
ncbi:MAG: hypothetical protein AAGI38_14885, partial [Bacteroidota bacterium]